MFEFYAVSKSVAADSLQSARQFEFFQSRAGKRIVSYFFQSVGKIYCAKLRLPAKGVFAYLLRACGNLARSAPRNHRAVRFSRQTVALAGKRFVVFGHGYFFKSDAKLRQPHPAFKSSAPKASSFNETQVENALSPTLVTPVRGLLFCQARRTIKKHTCLCL